MDKIAVLIPCYNEEKSIGKVIDSIRKYMPLATIYVYDNNSKDNTAKIALEKKVILRKEYKQGKGNVIRCMFREIDAECYFIVDGDNTYDLSKSLLMCNYVLEGKASMVIGDRSKSYKKINKRRFHTFGNKIVCFLINKIFKTNFNDIMSGCRALSYDFVKNVPILSQGFEIETEMTIYAIDQNYIVKEIPIRYRNRDKGSESKLNTYKDGAKVLKTIAALFKEYKPMKFFSFISIVIFFCSTIFFIPVLKAYFDTGLVLKFPTLIVCCFMYLTSLLSLMIGIILEVISKKYKQITELLKNKKP